MIDSGGGDAFMGSLKEELLEALGAEGLRKLAEARGGRRAYVPHEPRDSHWLVRALGREAAGRLAWRYGGCRIEVPRLDATRSERDERIRELRARGWSTDRIAAEVSLSGRWVREILARRG